MNWSTISLLLFSTVIVLLCYLLLNLNTDIVRIDLLFLELEISLGLILLLFFLIGLLVTIFLEVIYFTRRRKRNE